MPGGASQRRYINDATKRTIVCTRLHKPDTGYVHRTAVDLTTIAAFHDLPTAPVSRWPKARVQRCPATRPLARWVEQTLTRPTALGQRCWVRRVVQFCFRKYAQARKPVVSLAEAAAHHTSRRTGAPLAKVMPNCLESAAKQHMVSMVTSGGESWPRIVDELKQFALRWTQRTCAFKRRREADVPWHQQTAAIRPTAERTAWSEAESSLLAYLWLHGIRRWCVLQAWIRRRSNVQIKDRARTMKLASLTDAAIRARWPAPSLSEWSEAKQYRCSANGAPIECVVAPSISQVAATSGVFTLTIG